MKTIKTIGFLTAMFLFISATAVHDFHTSTTKIEFDKESSLIKISAKYFTDDLEKAVGTKAKSGKSFDNAVKAYVSKHFKISINGQPIELNFLGVEETNKAARIYLEVPNVKSVEQLKIQNDMLIAHFSDQQNFIDLNINGKRKSVICRKNKSTATIDF